MDCFVIGQAENATPIWAVSITEYDTWLGNQSQEVRNWLNSSAFSAKQRASTMIPDSTGRVRGVLLILAYDEDFWAVGGLPEILNGGTYFIDSEGDDMFLQQAALSWGLGCYQYTRYKKSVRTLPQLALSNNVDKRQLENTLSAIYLARDLINTPAEDMMPEQLAHTASELADSFNGACQQIVGDDLLKQGYPVIHAVGRASQHPPRLLDVTWGDASHPRLTLVGKGVCFDSGGLDLKNARGMRLMKKDMGGAAYALSLAQIIMGSRLPVRLRMLIPAVENAVSGNSFRPGDVLSSRKGLSIEVENTDAEGRLVLCDALCEAGNDSPELLIDFATLTGAARIALGTELPAFFTNSEEVAIGLTEAVSATQDPIWRLPLHEPYREHLKSDVADISNCASESFGGAITAALFLKEFVADHIDWVHFDIMAWNLRKRPGRPVGGEAMGLFTVFRYLQQRFK